TEGTAGGPFVATPVLIPPLLQLQKPPPQPLKIKGSFAVFSCDRNLKILPRDFQFYELSAEISGLPNGAFQVLRCAFEDDLRVKCLQVDLSVPEGDLGAGTDQTKCLCYTQFEFPTGPLIVEPGTTASVRVIVKSFEGVR